MAWKKLIASLALLPGSLLVPASALSQDTSIVKQYGVGNIQTTAQVGDNFAVKVQIGSGNNAASSQAGDTNFSAIAQIGDGHTRSHNQTGNTAESSVQVSTDLSGYTSSVTVANGAYSIKSSLEAN